MGIQALDRLQALLTSMERVSDTIPESIIIAAKSAVSSTTDYSKSVSNRLASLQNEVTAAYRMRDLYNIRRLSQRKLLVLIRSKSRP